LSDESLVSIVGLIAVGVLVLAGLIASHEATVVEVAAEENSRD
jgi:hypothetical protein